MITRTNYACVIFSLVRNVSNQLPSAAPCLPTEPQVTESRSRRRERGQRAPTCSRTTPRSPGPSPWRDPSAGCQSRAGIPGPACSASPRRAPACPTGRGTAPSGPSRASPSPARTLKPREAQRWTPASLHRGSRRPCRRRSSAHRRRTSPCRPPTIPRTSTAPRGSTCTRTGPSEQPSRGSRPPSSW